MLEQWGEKRYWYRYQRQGKKVRRIYAGAGQDALAAAQQQEERRQAKKAEEQQERALAQQHAEALAPLESFSDLLDLVTKVMLARLGFRQHARGHWRLQRRGRQERQG
jgi:hypothetical protein